MSRYAKLRGAKLSYSNLSFCNFERADMTSVEMVYAILSGVRMACATMEGANCANCNFQVRLAIFVIITCDFNLIQCNTGHV